MRVRPLVILAALCTIGCGPEVSEHGPRPDPEPPRPPPSMPPAPTVMQCDAQTFPITTTAVPPNVYLLGDRSGAMSDAFGSGTTGTKWDAAKTSLNTLLNGNAGSAQWGLSLFPPNPSQNSCGAAQIDVPLQIGDEATILSKINALTNSILANPRGSTPTADALKTVRDQAGLTATDRNNYVVLVTDGIPQCNDPADVGPVIDQLYNRSPSVKTFVVGIGSETASNPMLLNAWAEKGHTARTGQATEYYQADDASQLTAAFATIIGATASCTYKLLSVPQDPTLVVGELDGMPIAMDAANGFTYDASNQAVVFHGTACDSITSGQVMNVGVTYGCPPTTTR